MATVTATGQLGSRSQSGNHNVIPNGSSADVTLSFDDTKIVTKGQLLDVCRTLIDHLSSGKLK